MFKYMFISLTIALFFTGLASAEETISSMQKKIDTFLSSPDHFFVPETSSKALSYLGAARLADEQEKITDVKNSLRKSLAVLTEARKNSTDFQKKHENTLQLRQAAQQTIKHVPKLENTPQPDPVALLKKAEAMLSKAIKANEDGELNIASQTIHQARQAYILALQAGLPFLIDETGDMLSKSLSARAKRYAPQSYQTGKQELIKIQQYSDGFIEDIPLHPTFALSLFKHALEISTQAKTLRKNAHSYEQLLLSAQQDRRTIAASLGMHVDQYDAEFDVSIETISKRIPDLKAKFKQLQQKQHREIAKLKAQQQIETDQLRVSLLSGQHKQLNNMKEAFRAKLDRETFEQRRQKQVRDLFKQGEVQLLVNLDGSVLLRLLALDFASNRSKISRKHHDLLNRTKTALEAYGDRKIRIEGHTDSMGDAKPNQRLSLKRAEAVRDFLIAARLKAVKLTARGWGESFPIATNDYKQGRAKNRRIDIIIQAAE